MTNLITLAELEDLGETELRSKFCQILNDMARKEQQAQECPLAMASLQNIQTALRRKRMQCPKL
jgi:hypothetical protein